MALDQIKKDVIFQAVGSQCRVSSARVTIRFDFLRRHTGTLPFGNGDKKGMSVLRCAERGGEMRKMTGFLTVCTTLVRGWEWSLIPSLVNYSLRIPSWFL